MSVDTEISTDPTASPLRYFGSEVRLERERLGMTRAELGKIACCSYSLVAKIETGDRVPTLDFARACDATFPYANGRFERFWPLALRYAFPPWFRPYAELEWKATVVRTSQPILIPGLAQTPEYARALLRSGRPANLEDLVTARMERQHVLTREHDPVRLWIVMRENVLTNTVGDPEVMREQLIHLRKLAETPHHRVQILRGNSDIYGAASPWNLVSFNEGADIVHVDGFPRGYNLADPDDVAAAQDAYDLLTANAEPPNATAELIDSVLKGHYA
ncbi:helix-turn-helix transcriptional regulator [Streptomyces cocklensis]|uniref:Predicted transcription factor, homolog of eukaryotic MBF1 n=1 Tax=Actinacidiphila cocklensis TaxID=887465 RepID=A0A9W4E495_9ACTN|nr:helix-turn-helix transcriptional regulator [Actinacidiphila cocklensis]MDD1057989.1 helix-turn-helix transcriptional regulator [Actinacidiphila cocklensis]CAG6393005.1 Predicted transcription factor, homolog of eukaryotic MBF1 [Actinacidiphila cocklensis]